MKIVFVCKNVRLKRDIDSKNRMVSVEIKA